MIINSFYWTVLPPVSVHHLVLYAIGCSSSIHLTKSLTNEDFSVSLCFCTDSFDLCFIGE